MQKHITQCPRCFAKFKVSESHLGKRFPCPKCNWSFELSSHSPITLNLQDASPEISNKTEQDSSLEKRHAVPPVPSHQSDSKNVEPPIGVEIDPVSNRKSQQFKILAAATALIVIIGVSYLGWRTVSNRSPTVAESSQKPVVPNPTNANQANPDQANPDQANTKTPPKQQSVKQPTNPRPRTAKQLREYAQSENNMEPQSDNFDQQGQITRDMQRLQGTWQAVQPGFANKMTISSGGTVLFNPESGKQTRGYIRLDEDFLISIENDTHRELNFHGRYQFGKNTLTLIKSGAGKHIFTRVDVKMSPAMAANSSRGPRFPIPGAGQRPSTSPSGSNAAPLNRPPRKKEDYGPLLEGNAYLLLGEWEFSRISKPNPTLPGKMTLLHDGQALFHKNRLYYKKDGPPLVGSYRLIGNNKLEFTAPFIKGEISEIEFVFDKLDGRNLIIHDPKSGKLLGTYTRTISNPKMRLVDAHPEFKFKKWMGNGRITLMQAIKHHLVELTVSRPYSGLARNQLNVDVSHKSYFYPSRVELVVEPGMPISIEGAEMLVASAIQTDSKGKEASTQGEPLSRDNVMVLGGENSFYGKYCRLTVYSFSSRDNVMSEIGYKQGAKRILRFEESDEEWKMPSAKHFFDEHDIDRYDPSTELAINVLGAIWVDKSAYLSLNPRYSNLPSSKPGWPQAVHRVKRLLNFDTDQAAADPLIGLWTSEIPEAEPLTEKDKAANANASEMSLRLFNLRKQGEKSFGQRSKLILQNEGRFLLIDPPVTAPKKRRYEGTWKKSGSTISLTPEYTSEELADKRYGDAYRKNNVYKLKISGDKLEYVGLKLPKRTAKHAQHITPLKRHIWMTGPPPTPEQLARAPQKRTHVSQLPMKGQPSDGSAPTTKKRSKSNSALNPPQDWGKLIDAKKVTFTPIALTGQLAPGPAEGALFQGFTDPVINSQGQVAFTGTIVGNNASKVPYGQFLASQGKLIGFGISGHSHSPKTRSKKFGFVDFVDPAIHLDDQGSVYFICNYGGLRNVLVQYRDGQLTHCIYDQMPVKGIPDTTYTYGHKMTFNVNSAGQLLVSTRFDRIVGSKKGMLDSHFFVFGKPDNLKVLFREDSPTPDGNDLWAFFNGYAGGLSGGENHIVFAAGLRIPDKKRDYVFSAWQGLPNDLTRILDEKMKLQLSKTSEVIKRGWIVGTNVKGDVLMRVEIDKSTFNRTNKALVLHSQGELKVLVDPTQPIPKVKPTAYFNVSDDTVVNANGDVAATLYAFTSNPRNPTVSSDIWLWKEGKPKRVLTDPRQYRKKDRFRRKFSMNANCQILFNDSSRGGGRGLCLADEKGKVQILVPLNGVMELTPGDRRRVKKYSDVILTGGNDSRRRQLNDAGQVAIRIQFDDDTEGIFLVEVKN